MIGDRIDSDMQFGRNGQLTTLLVFSGCTKRDAVSEDEPLVDYKISHFGRFSSVLS